MFIEHILYIERDTCTYFMLVHGLTEKLKHFIGWIVCWYSCYGYTKSYFEYLTILLHFLPSNFVILHNKLFALECNR